MKGKKTWYFSSESQRLVEADVRYLVHNWSLSSLPEFDSRVGRFVSLQTQTLFEVMRIVWATDNRTRVVPRKLFYAPDFLKVGGVFSSPQEATPNIREDMEDEMI